MKLLNLTKAVEGVPSLRAILLTTMPDCMLFDAHFPSFSEANEDDIEDAAAFFGDLIRANRETLKLFGSWSSNIQFLAESDELTYSVWGLRDDFVIGFVFDTGLPTGMLRHFTRRMFIDISDQIDDLGIQPVNVPEQQSAQAPQQSRGAELLEYLQLYAPDPHASMFRIAVKSGIPVEDLEQPELLNPDSLARIEQAVCDILGIDQIEL